MVVQAITTLAEFDEKIAAASLTVVDFYADWCGPCKVIAPKVEALSSEETDVAFLKVNVDVASEVAEKCEISAMPTFQLFKAGEKVDELVGADFDKLKELVGKNK